MSTVSPSWWVLAKYPEGEYSVFSGTGDTWRRSSSIQAAEETYYGWLVRTETSEYKLYEVNIGITGYMENMWNYAMNKARSTEAELPTLLRDLASIHRTMRNIIKYRSNE